jgi:hypothetical protein
MPGTVDGGLVFLTCALIPLVEACLRRPNDRQLIVLPNVAVRHLYL